MEVRVFQIQILHFIQDFTVSLIVVYSLSLICRAAGDAASADRNGQRFEVRDAVKPESTITSTPNSTPPGSPHPQADRGLVTGVHNPLDHRTTPIRYVVG